MRRLFAYIVKFNFFFLFLLLEMIAFAMLVQNNYQKASFLNTTNRFTGSVFQSVASITNYFSLKKTNNQLLTENKLLRKQLETSQLITDTNTYYTRDSLFSYIDAKVIRNTINKQKNYLLLDKGSKQGVEVDMGVITSGGIMGTVIEVSERFSKVMSVLNIQNKINARIKKNNHLGTLEWDGKDYRTALLTDVPAHIFLEKGDTIITSGNSTIFPEGIPIGTVEENITETGQKFNRFRIKFFVDYNQVHTVYVIKNIRTEEIKSLTEEAE